MDFVQLFFYILPAYFANSSPVFFRGRRPLDGGAKLSDGNPVLGKNKTIRGTVFGLMAGITIGVALAAFEPQIFLPGISFTAKVGAAVLLSIGAVFGDLLGSFVKWRFKLKPGKSVPVLDQTLFFVSAVVFASPVYVPGLDGFLFLLVLTPVLHVAANMVAHRLKLKRVPW